MVVFRLSLRIEIFSVCLCLVRLPSRSKAKRTLSQRICLLPLNLKPGSAALDRVNGVAIVQPGGEMPDQQLLAQDFAE